MLPRTKTAKGSALYVNGPFTIDERDESVLTTRPMLIKSPVGAEALMASSSASVEVPEGLLPIGVTGKVMRINDPVPPLFPAERKEVAGAGARRVAEFSAGRAAARLALAAFGVPAGPIPARSDRTPQFPVGVVGSLSHCRTIAFAAVARRSAWMSIGVDVEDDEPLPAELVDLVTTAVERSMAPPDTERWAKVLFSAKEAVYKCWYTAGGHRLLEFSDVILDIRMNGTVRVLALPPPRLAIDVRWVRIAGLVWTAAAIAAS